MNISRFLRVVLLLVASLFVFTACMPMGAPTGEGGGTVYVGDRAVGGGTGNQPATGNQPQHSEHQGGEPAPAGGGMLTLLFPILAMFGVMYFLVIRPQRKQAKNTKAMQESLRVGDNVVTTSGFYGKIVGAGTDSFLVEFGEGRGFKVWVRKLDIAGVKTPIMTPPPSTPDKEDSK